MKRVGILVILFGCFVSAGWGQQATGKNAAKNDKPVYYDTFKEKWLDPAKWLAIGPWCVGSLECVREIENGHLRLQLRDFGATDSDAGAQYSDSFVDFVNPNAIDSITADVTVRSFSGIGCASNNTDMTHTQVSIGGNFFNTGTGDPQDDVAGWLILWVDTTNPKTVNVGNWSSVTDWITVDSYPLGTPLTATFAWDKTNHQFIAVVKAKGEPGPGKEIVAPYNVSDTLPPAYPRRSLDTSAASLNCTSAKTFAQVEAFYDNVMINQPAP